MNIKIPAKSLVIISPQSLSTHTPLKKTFLGKKRRKKKSLSVVIVVPTRILIPKSRNEISRSLAGVGFTCIYFRLLSYSAIYKHALAPDFDGREPVAAD